MSDTVEELPAELGMWLGRNLDAIDTEGDVAYAGWAGYFELSEQEDLPEELDEYVAVIVVAWKNGEMAVEGFGDHNIAGYRWLTWWDCFRETPSPQTGDIIFTQDLRFNRFVVAPHFKIKEYDTMAKWLRKKLEQPEFAGRQVWYLDEMIGNYYHWEL